MDSGALRVVTGLLAALLGQACCPSTGPGPWDSCRDAACAPLSAAVGAVPATPSIVCAGFSPAYTSADFCTGSIWPPAGYSGTPSAGGGRYYREFWPNELYGYRFQIGADLGTGRARFCRSYVTDCCGGDCPPSDWMCATSGTLVLSAVPTPDTAASVRGHVTATFPGGATVDAVY